MTKVIHVVAGRPLYRGSLYAALSPSLSATHTHTHIYRSISYLSIYISIPVCLLRVVVPMTVPSSCSWMVAYWVDWSTSRCLDSAATAVACCTSTLGSELSLCSCCRYTRSQWLLRRYSDVDYTFLSYNPIYPSINLSNLSIHLSIHPSCLSIVDDDDDDDLCSSSVDHSSSNGSAASSSECWCV